MENANKISQAHSEDIFTRIRPLLNVIFDWLTIEPIWRGYQFGGKKAAALVGFGLIFLWYFVIAIPSVIVSVVLIIPGIISSGAVVDTVAPLALIAAVILTGYGGYRAWSLLDDRRTVYGYATSPDTDAVVDSFDYLHRDDKLTRELAAEAIATGMENEPQQITRTLQMETSEVVFEIADLLHDKSAGVRQSGSESLVYLSEEFPGEVAKYRDDVYSGMTYPDSVVQSNCALIAGNMANYEPALIDEAVQYVAGITEDPDPDVRACAAIALGLMPNKKANSLLQKLNEDSNPEVRKEASKALESHTKYH